MTDMKRPTALTAAAPRPGTISGRSAISQTTSPTVFAWFRIRACVVSPMPRFGELTMRPKATASLGFVSQVRYASASLISARS